MQNVSDKPVKWQDENDGWHVGHRVLTPEGEPVDEYTVDEYTVELIRETPCGTLTWVHCMKLTDYVVPPEFK